MLHSYLFENYYIAIAINSFDYLDPEGKPCFDMGRKMRLRCCGCDVLYRIVVDPDKDNSLPRTEEFMLTSSTRYLIDSLSRVTNMS